LHAIAIVNQHLYFFIGQLAINGLFFFDKKKAESEVAQPIQAYTKKLLNPANSHDF
jgi:hypothetical protein